MEWVGEFHGSGIACCLAQRLAAGVVVFASSVSVTFAAAQQVAASTEDNANAEGKPSLSPRLTMTSRMRPMPGKSCLSIRARRPEQSSSIRANAISISCSRTIWPFATASASGASVSNGRASSGCHRNRSGRTGACRRKWSDGSPICLGSWRAVRAIPSAREPSISATPIFRIHGTNQPETIGHAVSSGCFRLDNADVIDLYDRVQVGAKVVVKQSAGAKVAVEQSAHRPDALGRLIRLRERNAGGLASAAPPPRS